MPLHWLIMELQTPSHGFLLSDIYQGCGLVTNKNSGLINWFPTVTIYYYNVLLKFVLPTETTFLVDLGLK